MKIEFKLDGITNLRTKGALDPNELASFIKEVAPYTDEVLKANYGFISLPETEEKLISEIETLADEIRQKFENFVIVGIGGSNLGNLVLHTALNHPYHNFINKPRIFFIDNPDPENVAALFEVINPEKTCFNVITKSGSTAETMAAFMYLRSLVKPENIVATTDPEKGDLLKIAREEGFKILHIPPSVGGRFSVLTPVGLLSAAVSGINIRKLLEGAAKMKKLCSIAAPSNPAAAFAAAHLLLFRRGVNMLVLMPYSTQLHYLSDWFRQLWAESLGKRFTRSGRVIEWGQTPVKAVGTIDQHSQIQLYNEGPKDKVVGFIKVEKFRKEVKIPEGMYQNYSIKYLSGVEFSRLINTECTATQIALQNSGCYNWEISIAQIDEEHIGALFFLFEMATAIAGEYLDINAFDQPGVEAGKVATYALLGREGFEEEADRLKNELNYEAKFKWEANT